ncbi:MAG TPA: adenylate/guanylate cyclase domain-containing protein [Thermomicrobiales bacterium]|nr:adenylate/guanylate cyclase domain-containing protein [Thermomicrobiales bacterium]
MNERRFVTVLFCDVTGSTALASKVDAEEWADIISTVFPILIDPVERYAGTVARLMGDGILAFFGAPVAREDDPQRAILAALEILSGIEGLQETLRVDYGLDLNVRVGINTGMVVTGEFGSRAASEYTAMGDAVNVAARMEQSAEPGTIQVTAETFRLTAPFFEFEPLGLVTLKGKDDGVETYRVIGRSSEPRRKRGIEDLEAPLVGRHRELDLLRYRLNELATGGGGVIAIIADAGLGKTRLLDELRRAWLSGPDRLADSWIEDPLVSFEDSTPYGLVQRRLLRELNIREGFSLSAVQACLDELYGTLRTDERDRDAQAVIRLLGGDPRAAQSSGSLGPDGAEDFRQELASILERIWHTRTERLGSCVYVIDDFHSIDPASAGLLERLLPDLLDLPILIVLAFRPEHESPCWFLHERLSSEMGISYLTVSLAPLRDSDANLLIDTLLPSASFPSSLRDMILERIDGNPLFAEEIVRTLIEREVIVPEPNGNGSRWRIASEADLATLAIPTTLQPLIQERMDRLDAGAKRTLQLAAVIGSTFRHDELLAASEEPDVLDAHLQSLQRAMLIRPDRYRGSDKFVFHHALIWEAVYRSMLRRNLRSLHRQVGEALERLHGDALDEQAGLLAQHYSKAGDERAIAYATAAGERAQSLFAPEEAIVHFNRALETTSELGRMPPAQLLRQRGRAYETRGSFEEARRDFEAALALAEADGNLREEWETLVDIGRSWEGVDFDRAGTWFERAIELARQLDDPLALAHSLNRVGTWYTNTELVDPARTAHLEALTIFEQLNDEPGIAATVDYLGMAANIGGDLNEMRARWEQAAGMFERLGDRHYLSSTLASMGLLRGGFVFESVAIPQVASYEEAVDRASHALRLARESGWRAGEAYALTTLASSHLVSAEYGRAFDAVSSGIEISHEIGHPEWLAADTAILGCLYNAILAADLAIEALEEASELARSSGSRHWTHMIAGHFIDALTAKGLQDNAGRLLQAFDPGMLMQTVGQRRLWIARATWHMTTGDAPAALTILDRLLETGHYVRTQQDIPLVAWRRGRALISLHRHAEAEEALLAARAGATRIKEISKLWRIELDLARFYYLLERDAEASQCLATAREIVERIAPSIPDNLRAGFLTSAHELFGAASDLTISLP